MQARAYFAIGRAHHLKNEFAKALEYYLVSEEVFENILKNKRIDDVSELYKALALLGVAIKQEDLTAKYFSAHLEAFGTHHPRTEEIIAHLDDKGVGIPF